MNPHPGKKGRLIWARFAEIRPSYKIPKQQGVSRSLSNTSKNGLRMVVRLNFDILTPLSYLPLRKLKYPACKIICYSRQVIEGNETQLRPSIRNNHNTTTPYPNIPYLRSHINIYRYIILDLDALYRLYIKPSMILQTNEL